MRAIRSFIDDHPVATFFLLAYALTWSIWFPINYARKVGIIETSPFVVGLLIAASFGPMVSAGIVTYVTAGSLRTWFSQLFRWRVAPRWWFAAFGIPVVLYALMAVIHLALGGTWNPDRTAPLVALPGIYLTVFLYGGGNEELGWRGFALPYLQENYSALAASLIIGVVWTLWHAPLGIVEVGFAIWATDLPMYMLNVVGISLVATLLYNNSGGSVLITMVLHAGVNGAQPFYPVDGMFTMTGEFVRLLAWTVLVGAILFTYGWKNFSRDEVPDSTQAGAQPAAP